LPDIFDLEFIESLAAQVWDNMQAYCNGTCVSLTDRVTRSWRVAMPLSDDVLRVGGRRVGYRLSGADTRPTLLYLHGAPSSRAEVGDYEPGLLEERGICAVAVDRPGYGATDLWRIWTCSPAPGMPLPWPGTWAWRDSRSRAHREAGLTRSPARSSCLIRFRSWY
jgi:hypothetical protein